MDNGGVYNATTEPQRKAPRGRCACTLRHLRGWPQRAAKALQALFSLLAVICEEAVASCLRCGGLYVFEFTSCSALLLSLLALCLHCTAAYEALGGHNVRRLNFYAMPSIGAVFLLASVVLAATSSGSHLEKAACAFGFFASTAFLAEGIMNYLDKRKEATESRSENPVRVQTATENQPLNK
ncbi:CKLF-like MARVEL transmembrane domain-containing protein 6 [Nothoprocta perdicaria]|uniref:CKLF-like MARVEL transmembrane domain-containing protein 6 n=1 Tax=Nothoprocta perdicaria TaxID=30464 RepID=UPI000E1B8E0E|nr:CKLF-like MARVEL transmembrane domain-containing protein 6 [Nothoprocta perdicaria]